ncbi:MAG: DUF4363 family protein [Clostridiaceae bacterium]|nr:DUF4363 family protein [Clostridiaceae bacterium]
MRAFKISIVLLIIIIISAIVYIKSLEKVSDEFIQQITQLEDMVKSERWDEAKKQLEDIEDLWIKKEKWMATLIDHEEIDNIKMTLAKLGEYVYFRETADFMAESATLKILIKHIPEKERISTANLF